MRSMLVIGLGRFGTNLAIKLAELGNEVMCVDKNEARVNDIADKVTDSQIGDCTDEDVIRDLGVNQYDVCFVCMSAELQSSLEITSLLKEHGAKCVVSKADRAIHHKFLLKIGADHIVNPERDMGFRTAMRYSMQNVFDFFEISDDYAVFEIETPESWVNKSAVQLQIRNTYNVNIIGTKANGTVVPFTDINAPFARGQHLLIAGSKKDLARVAQGSQPKKLFGVLPL